MAEFNLGKQLYDAVVACDMAKITEITELNANNAEVLDYVSEDDDKMTPLLKAVNVWHEKAFHPEMVECLLNAGANANAVCGKYHFNALRWCAHSPVAKLAMAKLLVSIGKADVDLRDKSGKPSLHDIRGGNKLEEGENFIKFLLENGADVNSRDSSGNTALMAMPRYYSVLLENGADVRAETETGYTALHSASARRGNDEAIKAMIAAGANIEAECTFSMVKGNTPFRLAIPNYLDSAAILLEAGANVNTVDADGQSPLHCAASMGNAKAIEFLLSKGADKTLIKKGPYDKVGYTAFDLVPAPKGTEGKPNDCYYQYKDEETSAALEALLSIDGTA